MKRYWPAYLISFVILASALIGGWVWGPSADRKVASSKKNVAAPALNRYPIILVHGFIGWDRNELAKFHYWGGYDDIQESLKSRGFDVRTAAVGPVSSNWDRACELYAYIKGGTVDYGAAHAKKHGHARFGRTYKGMYPEWDGRHKIHFVGHSMGGLTTRLLIHLLEHGSLEEKKASRSTGLSPLFKGRKTWVQSLTTISTPHNGTTLVDGVDMYLPLVQASALFFDKTYGDDIDQLYDLKLDHWKLNLKRNESKESRTEYLIRMYKLTEKLNGLKDFSRYDLSREGTTELNAWVKDSPFVYYQSWATEATARGFTSEKHKASVTMTPLFMLAAKHMGSYGDDREWYQNDGIVNTISMMGPSTSTIHEYTHRLKQGQRMFRGTRPLMDHFDIIGLFNLDPFSGFDGQLMDWYQEMAEELVELE